MRADEVVGWADLAGEAVARGAGHVEQVHRAVADRLFGLVSRATGSASLPARRLHDTVGSTVYASVRHGGRAVARVGGRVAGWAWPHEARAGFTSPVAAGTRATIIGLVGDQLAEAGSPVAWPVRIRRDGVDVPVGTRSLREAYPDATGRVVVLLPGLFETEHAWGFGAARWWADEHRATLPDRLRGDGWTPLHVRYPSSQPLVDNGRELAHLLRRVDETWPVPIEEVAVVGHSMGGLLGRHAAHVAHEDGHPWLARCRTIVCLGSPHGGSPVARFAASAAERLTAIPETRGIGDIVELRSPGIRDLEVTAPVPDVPDVDVHAVVAIRSRRTGRIVEEVIGDGLVGATSAGGLAGDGSRVRVASARTFRGLHHFDLLNHPDVDAHVRALLAGAAGRRQDGGVAMSTISGPTTRT